MKKMLAVLAVATASIFVSTVFAPEVLAQSKVKAEFEIPEPPPGKGQVIFYRSGGGGEFLGCAVFDVGATENLSSLGAGRYFVLVSDPGPRSFTVKSLETKDALAIEIEPDETKFVRCQIKMGIIAGRADIAPSSESEFRKKYKKPKLVDADDMSDTVRATNYPVEGSINQ
jgi:hypothetical protein